MATYTPMRLVGPSTLSASAVAVYTASVTTILKQLVFTNVTASTIKVSAHLVAVGGSATLSNSVIYELEVAPKSQIIWAADIPLGAGEMLQANASSGSSVNLTVSGIVVVA